MSRRSSKTPDGELDPVVQWLRHTRVARGWTQRDMADFLSVRQSMISDWETGSVHMSLDTARKITEKLGGRLILVTPDSGPD